MSRLIAKFLAGFALLAGVLVALLLVQTLRQPSPPLPALPNPNGYDDLLKAGGMLTGEIPEAGTAPNQPESSEYAAKLREYVTNNAEALKLATAALERECRVPLNFNPANSTNLAGLINIKHLAQTFCAKGKLAELENGPYDAAQAYQGACLLGFKSARGGLIIHELVSIAIEALGAAGLERVAPKLDARQCREIASTLEAAELNQEPAGTILQTEKTWSRRTFGWRYYTFYRLIGFRSARQSEQRFLGRLKTQQARLRRLLVVLSSRAYELEKGQPPQRLEDLVPAYLKRVPLDPLTGTKMVHGP